MKVAIKQHVEVIYQIETFNTFEEFNIYYKGHVSFS